MIKKDCRERLKATEGETGTVNRAQGLAGGQNRDPASQVVGCGSRWAVLACFSVPHTNMFTIHTTKSKEEEEDEEWKNNKNEKEDKKREEQGKKRKEAKQDHSWLHCDSFWSFQSGGLHNTNSEKHNLFLAFG